MAYAIMRIGGVKSVVVHDHASGRRSVPAGLRHSVKWLLARLPWIVADEIVAVSDYVARRQIQVGLIPPERVTRIWNGVPASVAPAQTGSLHEAFKIATDRPIVACACRAAAEKGVLNLLRAFDLLLARWPSNRPRPVLVYMGDGPQLEELQRVHSELPGHADMLLPGYWPNASALLADADVCAMPSVWQDALPLAVMQPMALGRPVVASNVGGIPEMIVDGETGLLVPPGDAEALASALERLLHDREYAERLGRAARERAAKHFSVEGQLDALANVVLRGMSDGAERR
jgi:glycosyltransferase involved in cell wall biosynthesis